MESFKSGSLEINEDRIDDMFYSFIAIHTILWKRISQIRFLNPLVADL